MSEQPLRTVSAIEESTVKSAVRKAREQRRPAQLAVPGPAALKETLLRRKMALSQNARTVLEKRYLKRDENGEVIETPEEMLYRVADNIAQAELKFDGDEKAVAQWTEKFYAVMADMDFLPNSPTLMNAGRELQQLSACFVLPVGDSMEQIFTAVRNTALIHKSGGGTGFSFSNIRPRNDRVKSTKGISSGPLSFMRVFDIATETVKQGGTRRGANMGILSCHHPEILDFIEMKARDGVLPNFNISVALTDEFMNALHSNSEYPLRNPRTAETVDTLKASEVFDRIVKLAWENGEPGIVFLDRINESNPTPHVGSIESTNPCGEQPLLPYESCNLGSINLAHMLTENDGVKEIDYFKLGATVRTAIRFLDNVIEMNRYPLEEIEEITKSNRKVGLGMMGFADMLIELGIPYSSGEAVTTAEKIMKFVQEESRKFSAFLAQERGVFPNVPGSIYDTPDGLRVRNATTTTIAPTGTISMIAGCSSGVEPLFALAYQKNVLDGKQLLEVHRGFRDIAEREGFYSEELMRIISRTGSLNKVYGIPKRIRELFVTAHDLEPRWHASIQSAFQKYTDNAVSKTVNFRTDAKPSDVADVFTYAYKLGCKGVTVYRDGSRKGQVVTMGAGGTKTTAGQATAAAGTRIHPRPRPDVTKGRTYKTKTGCGNLYVNINADEQGLCEVFTQMGKSGGCAASNAEAVSRLISLSLRAGVDPKDIAEQLRGIRCPIPTWDEGKMILSCADAIGGILERALQDFSELGGDTRQISYSSLDLGLCPQCPECGGIMENEGGCSVCKTCGYSKCG